MPVNKGIRKAAWHTFIAVAWRFCVFYLAVLLFLDLMALRSWQTSYAPSDAWARKVERRGMEWSPILGAAARALAQSMLPRQRYVDEESFYQDLLRRIKDGKVLPGLKDPDDKKLKEYRGYLAEKEKALGIAHDETTPRDEAFAAQVRSLRTLSQDIDTSVKKLAGLKDKGPASEVATEEAHLKNLLKQRKAAREEIKELSSERGTVETGFQKPLAEIEDRLQASEAGIKKTFEASLSSARPVDGFIARRITPKRAIQIGDEKDPMHIIYAMVWYGLEGAIAFLICIVVVPWLIRLGGGASDPNAVKSTVTSRIKGWLADAFGARAVAGAGKAVAAAAVTGLTIAGVSAAAGEQPPIKSVLRYETQIILGEKGEKGDPGSGSQGNPGTPGERGPKGENGKDGKDASIPQDLLDTLRRQADQIESQNRLIEGMEAKIRDLSGETLNTKERVALLANNADKLLTNTQRLTTDVAELTADVSRVDTSISGLTFANQLAMSSSDLTNRQLLQYLNRIQDTTLITTSDVGTVKSTVSRAEDVPPIAVDLLRITASPDGALARVSPFSRYKVTDGVIEVVKRATKQSNAPAAQAVLDALSKVKGREMRVWSLRRNLRESSHSKSDPAVRELLNDLMPLILKVSRV